MIDPPDKRFYSSGQDHRPIEPYDDDVPRFPCVLMILLVALMGVSVWGVTRPMTSLATCAALALTA